MQNLNVRLEGEHGNIITILEGKALEQKYPEKIKLSGNIESIAKFMAVRYQEKEGIGLQAVDRGKAIVVVDEKNMNIKLSLDPENVFGTEVIASLEMTDELKQFGIIEQKQISREEMIRLLKFNKRFFADPLKHEDLLKSYMKLNLSGSTRIKSESDDRGNKDLQFKKEIDSQNIPQNFTLEISIFKGQPVVKFKVDICIDVREMSVSFWFESVELVELIEMHRKEIFAEQLKSCPDFVIIHK